MANDVHLLQLKNISPNQIKLVHDAKDYLKDNQFDDFPNTKRSHLALVKAMAYDSYHLREKPFAHFLKKLRTKPSAQSTYRQLEVNRPNIPTFIRYDVYQGNITHIDGIWLAETMTEAVEDSDKIYF